MIYVLRQLEKDADISYLSVLWIMNIEKFHGK